MRGGILDWRRAAAVASAFDGASESHARRSATASRVAAFLSAHPKVSEVFHPSLPNHPDRAAIDRHYARHGSLLSFRIAGADEDRTRHYADVLATTVIVRYALSFDGLATKVNHHRTVSEYFTAPDQLKRNGFDRLIRLAVGPRGCRRSDRRAQLDAASRRRRDRRRDRTVAARSARKRWGSDMGAAAHLGIKPGEYDKAIATLIPHYMELIDAAAAAVDMVARAIPDRRRSGHRLRRARRSGSSKVRPKARLIGIDADAAMLAAATRRLRGQIRTIEDNFERARIPRCDVVSASFALHHIPTGRRKAALYKRCFASLRPGGMFVSADCFLASSAIVQTTQSRSVAQSPAAHLHAQEGARTS